MSQYADRLASLEHRAALGTLHPTNLLGRRADDGAYDPEKYRHLGKPVGGTFIAVALVFLVLGEPFSSHGGLVGCEVGVWGGAG